MGSGMGRTSAVHVESGLGVRREMAYLLVGGSRWDLILSCMLGFPWKFLIIPGIYYVWDPIGIDPAESRKPVVVSWGSPCGLAEIFVTLHSGQDPDGISILWGVIVPCMKIFRIFLAWYRNFSYLCSMNQKNIEQ